jgi:hypothetical protein
MHKLALAFIGFVFILLAAAELNAQEIAPGGGGGGGGGGVGQVTEYDFEDDLVTGDLVRPDGELVGARRKSKVSSLIKVRKHFIPEILKSVENL